MEPGTLIELLEKILAVNQEILHELRRVSDLVILKQEPDKAPLDNQDVMQLLKMSDRTLRRRRNEGLIPFFKEKGKIYYRWEDLLKYK